MKRLNLLLVAVLIVFTATAKNKTVTYNADNTITVSKTLPNFEKKHDLRVGLGSLSFTQSLLLDSWGCDCCELVGPKNLRENVLQASTHLSPEYYTGMFSLSYTYHTRRWFQYGGTLYFGAITRSRFDNDTGKKVENLNSYAGGVMPTVRFVYLYREKVQLYSAVSLGVCFNEYEVIPWGDLTLFGCSFGKKLFGFVELGAGFGGWGRVGIGYHFNAGKKNK